MLNRFRSAFFCLIALILTGCASTIDAFPQGPDGYDAIRFRRTIQVRDHLINQYTFLAGSTFVADKVTQYGPIYCGEGQVNGMVYPFLCIGVEGSSTLVIGPGAGFKEVRRPQPDGTFDKIKVKR